MHARIRIQTKGPLCRPYLGQSGPQQGGSRRINVLTLLPPCQCLPNRSKEAQDLAWHTFCCIHPGGPPGHRAGQKSTGGTWRGTQRVPSTSPLPQLDWWVPDLSCLCSTEPRNRCPRAWTLQQENHLLFCISPRPHPSKLCLHTKLVQPHHAPAFLPHLHSRAQPRIYLMQKSQNGQLPTRQAMGRAPSEMRASSCLRSPDCPLLGPSPPPRPPRQPCAGRPGCR